MGGAADFTLGGRRLVHVSQALGLTVRVQPGALAVQNLLPATEIVFL